MPLNASTADLRVNLLECWEWNQDKVQHCSWVTDLRVNKGTVYQRMRGGRARWRIANETFHTLKNQGYHCEHNFGHGYQHLSVVFAMLMMLAFLVDQVQQLCCPLCQAAWAKCGSKRLLWEKMRALFYDDALDSMQHLFEALVYGFKQSMPILDFDASSATSRCHHWVRPNTTRSGSIPRAEVRLGKPRNPLGVQYGAPSMVPGASKVTDGASHCP